jgi:hypothetical protein
MTARVSFLEIMFPGIAAIFGQMRLDPGRVEFLLAKVSRP